MEEQKQQYHKRCEDRNLYVSNLDESIDDKYLTRLFERYGTITSTKVK